MYDWLVCMEVCRANSCITRVETPFSDKFEMKISLPECDEQVSNPISRENLWESVEEKGV